CRWVVVSGNSISSATPHPLARPRSSRERATPSAPQPGRAAHPAARAGTGLRLLEQSMTTKIVGWVLVAVALTVGSGCAKKEDWTDRLLVKVDVTGTWQRTEGGLFTLRLTQVGPKVDGSFTRWGLSGTTVSGDLEGTVAGDVFRFKQTSGLGTLSGEMD